MTSSTLFTATTAPHHHYHLPSPSLFMKKRENIVYHLPPIQLAPNTPPFDTSPTSSIASSPTPEQDDYQHSSRRKGSIASILNSDPELKLLDERSYKLKRGRPKQDQFETTNKKQRQYLVNENTRPVKGLRHFSKQVCDKVAEKGITTYNEVADDLAMDIQQGTFDQKNIRRRVYDALNVLMAMDIIQKDKKVIKWLGIPDCYNDNEQSLLQQIEQEERRQNELVANIDDLRNEINVKLNKHSNIQNLVQRNKSKLTRDENKVALPFFLIASNDENISINVQPDRKSASISFQKDTEQIVIEDTDILNSLHL